VKKGTLGKEEAKYGCIIMDAMNLVKRFNWVFRKLKDGQGRETGVLYGMLNHVLTMWKRFGKMNTIMVWDCKSLIRREVCPEYKANRKHEHEDSLWEQVRILKIALSFMGGTGICGRV
jgi:5'-3' exonuclease